MKLALLPCLIMLLLLAQNSFAEEVATVDSPPCIKVLNACKAYAKSNGKSPSRDCMKVVINEKGKIDGLAVDDTDIEECRRKKKQKN